MNPASTKHLNSLPRNAANSLTINRQPANTREKAQPFSTVATIEDALWIAKGILAAQGFEDVSARRTVPSGVWGSNVWEGTGIPGLRHEVDEPLSAFPTGEAKTSTESHPWSLYGAKSSEPETIVAAKPREAFVKRGWILVTRQGWQITGASGPISGWRTIFRDGIPPLHWSEAHGREQARPFESASRLPAATDWRSVFRCNGPSMLGLPTVDRGVPEPITAPTGSDAVGRAPSADWRAIFRGDLLSSTLDRLSGPLALRS